MKATTCALILLLATTSCGGGSTADAPAAPPANPPTAGPSAADLLATDLQGLTLAAFFDQSYAALISRSPERIVWQALDHVFPLQEAELDNYSDAYRRDTIAMHQVVLDMLLAFDRSALSSDDQLNFDVYEWHLRDVVERLEFFYYDFVASFSLFGVQRDTQQLFTDIHPLATRQDAENFIRRLQFVSIKFSQLAEHLQRQRAAGIVEPLTTLQIAINEVARLAQTNVDAHPYFTAFRDKIGNVAGLGDTERQDLVATARSAVINSVIPAYRTLQAAMQSLTSVASPSIGVGQFTRGGDYYTYMLRHHTTTRLTAAEIHQLGLDELQRIHTEMRLIFDQLGYPQNETLQQLFARVAFDGGIVPAADVVATYESIIGVAEQNLDQAFDIFPAAGVVVRPDDFGGYYIGPSFDGTRPGAFYAGTRASQPWFQMPSLTYHESVPGHHTQIALAMEQDVPLFRKLVRSTAFVEGWALYAERLAYELGWYDGDPYGNLGRLQFEAMRAARLVMDTGIHSFGWSFNRAAQFSNDNVGWANGDSQGATARYSVIPGQATAYMIGMLKILQARQRAMDQLGQQFDLKEFHRVVLSNGGVPLELLDSLVDQYIAGKI